MLYSAVSTELWSECGCACGEKEKIPAWSLHDLPKSQMKKILNKKELCKEELMEQKKEQKQEKTKLQKEMMINLP